ncbi:hypothetical protein [Nonomuraea harbinensis]|uniref:Glycerol-3-phosphate dehydrogenase NAD-dependent N-terminal domain-containing protein n=1 Tax=Nonomuraea harbinensis TaxID=1286938 RepID=A0ABW1C7R1_9ACTN|nr:hypothetical protein [Nonomuraea harbinensis]
MRTSVFGAGSWGTTVAALVCKRHDTLVWSRDPGVAEGLNATHRNQVYLPGFDLPETLRGSDDPGAAARAQVLIVGVPSHAFRQVL